MKHTTPGLIYRNGPKGPTAVRAFVDFPLPEGDEIAAEVAALAAAESKRTGEIVPAMHVLRRAIRKGLPIVRAEVHPIGTADTLAGMPADRSEE